MFETLGNRGMASTALVFLMFTLVLSTAFTGTAAAQVEDPESFICDNEDTVFVSFMQTIIGLFFIGSFAFGIISFIVDKADDAAGKFDLIPWAGEGKNAMKAAFILPVGVWFLTFIGNALFGYDLTCLMPLQ